MTDIKNGNQQEYRDTEEKSTQLEKQLYTDLDEQRVEYERKIGVRNYLLTQYEKAYDKARKKQKKLDVVCTINIFLQGALLFLLTIMLVL